jgi:DNA recombination protein RmuC
MDSWWAVLREQNAELWLTILVLSLLSFVLGWFVARLSSTRKISLLEAMLELEMKSSEERIAGLEKSFTALSAEALRENNQSFLQLAGEVLGRHYSQADHGLQARETAIDNMVKPLREALKTTHEQLDSLDKSTRQTQGELSGQIKAMSGAQALLHQETRHLAHALRRPEVRGQWGEITLRRLLELSGMNAHADFTEQASIQTEEGLIRPDLIVHLPENRQIVVDVKTPLDAYLDAYNSEDSALREAKLIQHAGQLKKRIRELAQKQYWAQFDQAPDFIVLFIPGDQFLAAALDQQPELLEYALAKKVVLATPTSLVALLRVIAHGWQQSVLDEQGKVVRELAGEFDKRLEVFSRHLAGVGRDLSRTVETYNRAIGSYEHKVRPISRKFDKFNPDTDRVKVQSIETVVKEPGARSD